VMILKITHWNLFETIMLIKSNKKVNV